MSNGDGEKRHGASEDAERAGARMKAEMGAASDAAGRGAEGVRQATADAASRMKEEATARGEQFKDQASEGISHFADALRQASDDLSSKQPGFVADLLGKAAGGLEDFSRSVGDTSSGEMLDGVRNFGRRNPMAFIAGSVLAGFAVGRLAGSSAPGKPFGAARQSHDGAHPFTTDGDARQDPLRPNATENMGGGL